MRNKIMTNLMIDLMIGSACLFLVPCVLYLAKSQQSVAICQELNTSLPDNFNCNHPSYSVGKWYELGSLNFYYQSTNDKRLFITVENTLSNSSLYPEDNNNHSTYTIAKHMREIEDKIEEKMLESQVEITVKCYPYIKHVGDMKEENVSIHAYVNGETGEEITEENIEKEILEIIKEEDIRIKDIRVKIEEENYRRKSKELVHTQTLSQSPVGIIGE